MSNYSGPDCNGNINFVPASRLGHDPRDHTLAKAIILVSALWLFLIWRVLLVL